MLILTLEESPERMGERGFDLGLRLFVWVDAVLVGEYTGRQSHREQTKRKSGWTIEK